MIIKTNKTQICSHINIEISEIYRIEPLSTMNCINQ